MPHGPSRSRYAILSGSVLVIVILILLWGPWSNSAPTRTASPEPEILARYSWEYTERIAGELQSPEGSIFLLMRLTLENRGYDNFTADPFGDMFVVVGVQSYNVSVAYFFLENRFKPATILNGDDASGEVVFEVPVGTSSFQPGWRTTAQLNLRFELRG